MSHAESERAYELFSNKKWRLNNLYRIRDKNGVDVPFKMNAAQDDLFQRMHYLNVILKARQLGFSTFIQIYMLDECLFRPNTAAATVAHTQHDASKLFDSKIKHAYDKLDPAIKAEIPAKQDSARTLSFTNGSSIEVGTSLRSGTYQLLHVSEYGKLCANTPEKAKEVKTGALNTVSPGNLIWIESTAEGSEGHFHEICKRAEDLERLGRDLTQMDYKFFFYDWRWEPEYSLDADVPIPANMAKYFSGLSEQGIDLTDSQKAWYVKKEEEQQDEMKREFPTTADEAWEASVEGAFYGRQMARVRSENRITKVRIEPDLPVQTFWDLGRDDETAIWFHQRHSGQDRFLAYMEGNNEDAKYWGARVDEWLKIRDLRPGRVYLPHDGSAVKGPTKATWQSELREFGFRDIYVIPRTPSTYQDIQQVRNKFPGCWFDEEECSDGIKALDNYKRLWDANRQTFKEEPHHDWASHGADAFRAFAVGYKPVVQSTSKPRGRARV